MKTAIIWIILLVALMGTIVFLLSQRGDMVNPFAKNSVDTMSTSSAPLTFDQATVYTCAGGEVVAAAFKTGDTTVLEVSLPDTNPTVMTQTEAASGAKYVHESGMALWEKGGTVLVEQNGEVIYAECKAGPVIEPLPIATSSDAVSGTQWIWNETSYATGSSTEPNEPEDFIVTFSEGKRFSANTDCNNVGGAYVGGNDGAISFTDMVSTLMACEGDVKESLFVNQLTQVVSYRITDNQLVLSLKSDEENGEMKFTKK